VRCMGAVSRGAGPRRARAGAPSASAARASSCRAAVSRSAARRKASITCRSSMTSLRSESGLAPRHTASSDGTATASAPAAPCDALARAEQKAAAARTAAPRSSAPASSAPVGTPSASRPSASASDLALRSARTADRSADAAALLSARCRALDAPRSRAKAGSSTRAADRHASAHSRKALGPAFCTTASMSDSCLLDNPPVMALLDACPSRSSSASAELHPSDSSAHSRAASDTCGATTSATTPSRDFTRFISSARAMVSSPGESVPRLLSHSRACSTSITRGARGAAIAP